MSWARIAFKNALKITTEPKLLIHGIIFVKYSYLVHWYQLLLSENFAVQFFCATEITLSEKLRLIASVLIDFKDEIQSGKSG